MKALYGKREQIIRKFYFRVNQGGAENLRVTGNQNDDEIVLVFIDGKLKNVSREHITGVNPRDDWLINQSIAEEIFKIEKQINEDVK